MGVSNYLFVRIRRSSGAMVAIVGNLGLEAPPLRAQNVQLYKPFKPLTEAPNV